MVEKFVCRFRYNRTVTFMINVKIQPIINQFLNHYRDNWVDGQMYMYVHIRAMIDHDLDLLSLNCGNDLWLRKLAYKKTSSRYIEGLLFNSNPFSSEWEAQMRSQLDNTQIDLLTKTEEQAEKQLCDIIHEKLSEPTKAINEFINKNCCCEIIDIKAERNLNYLVLHIVTPPGKYVAQICIKHSGDKIDKVKFRAICKLLTVIDGVLLPNK